MSSAGVSSAGAVLGLLLGLGLVLLSGGLVALRTPSTAARIAPYVPGLRHRSDAPGPLRTLALVAATVLPQATRVRRGRDGLAQIVHGAIGAAAGLATGAVATARGGAMAAPVILGAIGCAAGLLLQDHRSVRRARRRRERVERELPVVVDLLAFAVAAGESPMDAMRRVTGMAGGALAAEMRVAVDDVRAGRTVEEALRSMAARVASPDLDRFTEAVLVALERGTPLADVLRAQAADARAAQRRRLMEAAGRKDIAMLVPVVFLVLPVIVVIALFPGFRSLQVLVP